MKSNRDNRDNGALEVMSKNMENSKNNNIWNEITDATKRLMITNDEPNSFHIKSFFQTKPKPGSGAYPSILYLFSPECVVINLHDFPKTKLDLKTMPYLPNLRVLSFHNLKIKSLRGISGNFPNLSGLFIHNLNLNNIVGIPEQLPNLKGFSILNSSLKSLKGLPSELPSLINIYINNVPLETLQYLPKSLPNLENFRIIQTNIQTLEYFPTTAPELKKLILVRNKLVTLEGLPPEIPKLEEINLRNNQITSLEHLPYKFDDIKKISHVPRKSKITYLKPKPNLHILDNPIRTLAGIKFSPFFKTMAESDDYIRKNFQLCPTGLKLINDYHEKVETQIIDLPSGETMIRKLERDPALYDTIVKFYCKTPMELAQQYIENPDLMSDGEIERLGWEGGYQERQLLESNIPPAHHVLKEISQRLIHKLSSGHSILK